MMKEADAIEWTRCRELLHQFRQVGVRTLLEHGILLRQIRESKAHLVALQDMDQEVFEASGKMVMSEKQCWEQWLRRERNWTYAHAQRLISAADFYVQIPAEKQGVLASIPSNRLFELTTQKNQAEALEAAERLSDEDWEAWVLEGKGFSPEKASRQVKERKERAREEIKQRNLNREDGPWRSKKFRRFVRELPCCVCGLEDFRRVDPAHVVTKRVEDDYRNILPLCNKHHREQHQVGWDHVLISWGWTGIWKEQVDHVLKAYLRYLEGEE